MKEIFPGVAGNALLKERLAPKLLAGRLPHALILEGKAGSGRRTFAREIAMAAACEKRADPALPLPCGECEACRKIGNDLSPDILRIARAPGKATLGVEAVRGVRESVRTVPNDLDVKIYIIEDADTMTVQAQNALLLTLEEPPQYVLFLLLATDAMALLETIRSRAPVYRTQPVSEREMQEYLIAHSPEAARLFREAPEEAEGILRLSGGSIGEALRHIGGADRATLLQYRENAAGGLPPAFRPRFPRGVADADADLSARQRGAYGTVGGVSPCPAGFDFAFPHRKRPALLLYRPGKRRGGGGAPPPGAVDALYCRH